MNSHKVETAIKDLLYYGEEAGLSKPEDRVFLANQILDILQIAPSEGFLAEGGSKKPLEEILSVLLDDAVERKQIDGGIASRDLLDTKLMGCLVPRPSEVIHIFFALLKEDPKKATDFYSI